MEMAFEEDGPVCPEDAPERNAEGPGDAPC